MARRHSHCRQGELEFCRRGGKRRGTGRKRKGPRKLVSHGRRPVLSACNPVHVAARIHDGLPSLRCVRARDVIERAIARSADRMGFRVAHYSIQSKHVHILAEADDSHALAGGMQGLLVRIAKGLNKEWRRRGPVFADRYFARALATPREVRNALLYVLHNARHHGQRVIGIDRYSSGPWFDGWRDSVPRDPRAPPCASARTWLLREGWRRHGLIGVEESPRIAPGSRWAPDELLAGLCEHFEI